MITNFFYKLWHDFWWNHIPGVTVMVKWPNGPVYYSTSDDGIPIISSDPNDHYRNWLEANVGIKGIDWDWKVSPIRTPEENFLEIKFCINKKKFATIVTKMWA